MVNHAISCAAFVLSNNGIIAHYTDTIIGFACLPFENLLRRLIRIKHRPDSKGFILLASGSRQVSNYVQCNSADLATIDSLQPDPTTWLVTATELSPPSLLGESNKIAVRITNNAAVQSICDRVGPIVSTSANLSGQAVCKDLQQVRKLFGPSIDYIPLFENTGTGRASRIIDLDSGKIIR